MSDKKVTVRDLKTFIDAVEFASDQDDWVPSAKQWKRIREMINNLEEVVEVPKAAPAVQYQQPQTPVQYAPSGMPGMAVTQHSQAGVPQYGGVPSGGMPQINNPLLAHNGQVPVKTPDIDTGHGKPYQSNFAL